ncbi:hypothetical protein [Agrobacterium tumefaciens]|uniref:hypothetical protein n=2 Tax=Agrobacterium TaxID=357 RepID=UPI0010BF41F7|nr:hypothetical protein [Agrobacterium tumefaciens]QCL77402.1 hypothetical protein CFBP5499_28515 [Agrobacterium tumefaciens]
MTDKPKSLEGFGYVMDDIQTYFECSADPDRPQKGRAIVTLKGADKAEEMDLADAVHLNTDKRLTLYEEDFHTIARAFSKMATRSAPIN